MNKATFQCESSYGTDVGKTNALANGDSVVYRSAYDFMSLSRYFTSQEDLETAERVLCHFSWLCVRELENCRLANCKYNLHQAGHQ